MTAAPDLSPEHKAQLIACVNDMLRTRGFNPADRKEVLDAVRAELNLVMLMHTWTGETGEKK